jgi:hypothetical protein
MGYTLNTSDKKWKSFPFPIYDVIIINIAGIVHTSNYINKNNEHPEQPYEMTPNKVVFKKEDLQDDNWLYIGNEPREDIEKQFQSLYNKRQSVLLIDYKLLHN